MIGDKNTCPDCGSEKLIKFGWTFRHRERTQQYRCKDCGKITAKPNKIKMEG